MKLDTELKPRKETLLAHFRLKNWNIRPNPNLVKEMCLHLIFCSRTTCDSANSSRHILHGFAFILAHWKFWWVKNPISATSKTGREKCKTNIRSENAILGWEIFEWEGRKKKACFSDRNFCIICRQDAYVNYYKLNGNFIWIRE